MEKGMQHDESEHAQFMTCVAYTESDESVYEEVEIGRVLTLERHMSHISTTPSSEYLYAILKR